MGKPQTTLLTIGYEGADAADFIASLRDAAVTCLIDVRQLAISRRRGFAKTALSNSLTSAGINYIHLKGLGDPKEGREAAKSHDIPRFIDVFSRHMLSDIAQVDLATAVILAGKGGACLMCYERNHSYCHRSIVADAISAIVPVTTRHIGVSFGLASRSYRTPAFGINEQRA